MKKVISLMILVVISLVLISCNEKVEAPKDLSGMVTVEIVDNSFVFETEEAERELGRSYEFYTWQKLSKNIVSVKFYNKNAVLIGYANIKIEN